MQEQYRNGPYMEHAKPVLQMDLSHLLNFFSVCRLQLSCKISYHKHELLILEEVIDHLLQYQNAHKKMLLHKLQPMTFSSPPPKLACGLYLYTDIYLELDANAQSAYHAQAVYLQEGLLPEPKRRHLKAYLLCEPVLCP